MKYCDPVTTVVDNYPHIGHYEQLYDFQYWVTRWHLITGVVAQILIRTNNWGKLRFRPICAQHYRLHCCNILLIQKIVPTELQLNFKKFQPVRNGLAIQWWGLLSKNYNREKMEGKRQEEDVIGMDGEGITASWKESRTTWQMAWTCKLYRKAENQGRRSEQRTK